MAPRDTLSWWQAKLAEYNKNAENLNTVAWDTRQGRTGPYECKKTLQAIGKAIAHTNSFGLFKSVLAWEAKEQEPGEEEKGAIAGLPPVDEAWIRRIGHVYCKLPKDNYYGKRSLVATVCDFKVNGKGLRHTTLQELGFAGLGEKTLRSVRQHGAMFEPSTGDPETGGAPCIPPAVQNAIAADWKEACEPGANRSDGTEGERYVLMEPAYHVARAIVDRLKLVFPVSEDTVRKYRPPDVKEPCQLTDYCPVCNKSVNLEPQIRRSVGTWNKRCDKTFTLEEWVESKDLRANETQTAEDYITARREIKHHQRVRTHNKGFFRRMTKGILKGQYKRHGAILVDFKSNVVLNRGRREVSGRWHNRKQCALMGVKIWLPGLDKPIVVNLLSMSLSHTAFAAQVALERALELVKEHFPENWAQAENLFCFADCGPHYRANVFAGYLLYTLPRKYGKHMAHVSFCEGHGKCDLDQQFSNMEGPFKERVKRGDLNVPADAIEVLVAHHEKAKEQKYYYFCVEQDFMADPIDPFMALTLPAWAGVKATYCLATSVTEGLTTNPDNPNRHLHMRNLGLPEEQFGGGVPVDFKVVEAHRFIGPLLPTKVQQEGKATNVGNWNLHAMGQKRDTIERVLDAMANGCDAPRLAALKCRTVVIPAPKCISKCVLKQPVSGKFTELWLKFALREPVKPTPGMPHQIFLWTKFATGGFRWQFADVCRPLTEDEKRADNNGRSTTRLAVLIRFRNGITTEAWYDHLAAGASISPQPTVYFLAERVEEDPEEPAPPPVLEEPLLTKMLEVECELCGKWREVTEALATRHRWHPEPGQPFRCDMLALSDGTDHGRPLSCEDAEVELACAGQPPPDEDGGNPAEEDPEPDRPEPRGPSTPASVRKRAKRTKRR